MYARTRTHARTQHTFSGSGGNNTLRETSYLPSAIRRHTRCFCLRLVVMCVWGVCVRVRVFVADLGRSGLGPPRRAVARAAAAAAGCILPRDPRRLTTPPAPTHAHARQGFGGVRKSSGWAVGQRERHRVVHSCRRACRFSLTSNRRQRREAAAVVAAALASQRQHRDSRFRLTSNRRRW